MRIDRIAVQFLTIRSKVLYAGSDLLTLDSLDLRRDESGDEMRILAEVLEIASAKQRPGNVDAGSQDDVLATLPSLCAKNRSEPLSGLRIPGRGERDSGRQIGGAIFFGLNRIPAVAADLVPYAMWSIRHPELRNPKPWDSGDGELGAGVT